jgi:hypothetical protein
VEGIQVEGIQVEGIQVEGIQVEGIQVEGIQVEGIQVEEVILHPVGTEERKILRKRGIKDQLMMMMRIKMESRLRSKRYPQGPLLQLGHFLQQLLLPQLQLRLQLRQLRHQSFLPITTIPPRAC